MSLIGFSKLSETLQADYYKQIMFRPGVHRVYMTTSVHSARRVRSSAAKTKALSATTTQLRQEDQFQHKLRPPCTEGSLYKTNISACWLLQACRCSKNWTRSHSCSPLGPVWRQKQYWNCGDHLQHDLHDIQRRHEPNSVARTSSPRGVRLSFCGCHHALGHLSDSGRQCPVRASPM